MGCLRMLSLELAGIKDSGNCAMLVVERIRSLANLHELRLRFAQWNDTSLTAEGGICLCSSLRDCCHLRILALQLSWSRASDTFVKEVAFALKSMVNLRRLELDWHKGCITDDNLECISNSLM